jgi:hypothetical protein
MRVCVYVEGPSDKAAMEALLRPLIEQQRQAGVAIHFFETPAGDRKTSVLTKVPMKAVDILANDPGSLVVALPDLYPADKAFPHRTAAELTGGIRRNFEAALQAKGLAGDARVRERFQVFCFKHDLEALLLAAHRELAVRLGAKPLPVTWRVPVEDQDQENPPKHIVESLFAERGKRYRDTVDAPVILAGCQYQDIAERCPQCFGPFVEYLSQLRPPGTQGG